MDIFGLYNTLDMQQSQSKVNRVTQYIERKVRNKELKSGDQLPSEGELSEILGISRTAVREGVKQLEAQTILQVKQGARSCIAPPECISFDTPMLFKMLLQNVTLREIMDYREKIELCVCLNAIQSLSEADLCTLRDLNAQMERYYLDNPNDYENFILLDYRFHASLGHTCHNQILENLYDFGNRVFLSLTLRSHQKGNNRPLGRACAHHGYLIDALAKRDSLDLIYAVKCNSSGWENDVLYLGDNLFSVDP